MHLKLLVALHFSLRIGKKLEKALMLLLDPRIHLHVEVALHLLLQTLQCWITAVLQSVCK